MSTIIRDFGIAYIALPGGQLQAQDDSGEESSLCTDTGYYLTTFIYGRTADVGAKEFVMNVVCNECSGP